GRMARVPVVLAHEHSWSYQGQPMRRLLDRRLIARRADYLIAVSRADRRRMIEIEGIEPNRTLFIPNGIPPSRPARRRDLRNELGLDRTTPVVGSVGSLYGVKAFDVLVRATALLVGTQPDVRVLIAGGGPERAGLERLAHELGVETSVRFLGPRVD